MLRAHYVLQALLYSVALHRYLRWRQPGYDPAQHLGPVLYLFVRGMTRAARTRAAAGVFTWSPPARRSSSSCRTCWRGGRVIPMRAPGLLRAFCDAGVLVAADVHVALRLERLGGEDRDAVLLAAALAVRGVRSGSVCVDLATAADTVAPGEDAEPVELPWPRGLGRAGRHALWSPSGPTRRGGRCGSSTAGCTWTGTGSRSSSSAASWTSARRSRRRSTDLSAPRTELFDGPAPDRQRLAAAVAARPLGERARPAARAPARRTPSPGC